MCGVERREEGEGGGEGGRYGCDGVWVGGWCVVSLVCAVCDVGVCGCVGVWERRGGEEAKAILGDGGIGTAEKAGGLGTRVVLACPTCLQVLGVFTPLASWRLLSPHVLCVSA